MKINLYLKNIGNMFQSFVWKYWFSVSGFMFTDFWSRCLCSVLSPAGPKDSFSLHPKLLAPMLTLGRSSEYSPLNAIWEHSLLCWQNTYLTEILYLAFLKGWQLSKILSKLLHDASWSYQLVAL